MPELPVGEVAPHQPPPEGLADLLAVGVLQLAQQEAGGELAKVQIGGELAAGARVCQTALALVVRQPCSARG